MKRILLLLIIIFSFTSIYAQNLTNKNNNDNSIIESNNNTGLNDLEPTKENVLTALADFKWDNKNETNKNEAFRLLMFLGSDYEHYQEYESGEGYVCGKLPSGYYLSIFTDSFGKKNKYHVRYGLDKNHSYFSTQAYSNETTYDIDKNFDKEARKKFVLANPENFKNQAFPNLGVTTNSRTSWVLEHMLKNPPMLLTVEERSKLLSYVLQWVITRYDDEHDVPVIIAELNSNTSKLKVGDVIFGTLKNGKVKKVNLYNRRRILHKGDEKEIVILRDNQFQITTFDPDFWDYSFKNLTGYKNKVWDIRYSLVKMILNSGPVNFKSDLHYMNSNPMVTLTAYNFFYSKRILDLFIKYGADIYYKDSSGTTFLHLAAGSLGHQRCKFYEHKKQSDWRFSGSEKAYFDLIELGLSDTAKNKPHPTLNFTTPKEFYFLTFKNEEHKERPKEFDWNTLANAVVIGLQGANKELQRQYNENQQIVQINASYQNEVNRRIQLQKQHVAQSNAEYLGLADNSQSNYNSTSSTNTNTTQNTQDISGSNYTQNINVNSQNTSTNTSQNNYASLGSNKCVENPNWMPITYYSFRASLLDPETVKAAPYAINDCRKVINYRDQWVLNIRPIPNTLDEEWYPQLRKVEIVEIHDAVPVEQMQWKMDQIKSNPRSFLTYQGALNEVKENTSGIYWTLASAQEAADLRNKK
ncbi:MAG: hypothetical protein ACO3VF_00710 [Tamlana sp.]